MNTGNFLLLDIETSPYLAEVFQLWKVDIRPEQIVRQSEVICFGAKWLGAKRTEFRSVYHDGKDVMIRRLWDLLDQADVVVHYYGGSFDVPRIEQEFLLAGLGPPSPYTQLDLLKTSRRFRLGSTKLGAVLERLGLENKVKHEGQGLWTACLAMDPKAWAKMRRYNVRDVTALEDLYYRFGPWIKGHPNMGLFANDAKPRCARCGSTSIQRRGFRLKRTGKYQAYRCNDCRGWSTGTRRVSGVSIVAED